MIAPATGAPMLLPRKRNVLFMDVARPIFLGSTERINRLIMEAFIMEIPEPMTTSVSSVA